MCEPDHGSQDADAGQTAVAASVASSDQPAPPVRFVRFERARRPMISVRAVVFAILLTPVVLAAMVLCEAFAVRFAGPAMAPLGLTLPLLLGMGVPLGVHMGRMYRRRRTAIARWPGCSAGEIVRQLTDQHASGMTDPTAIRRAVEQLYARPALRGRTWVACCTDALPRVRPIGQPFEPRPLSELDPAFEALRAAHEDGNPAAAHRRPGMSVEARRTALWAVIVLFVVTESAGLLWYAHSDSDGHRVVAGLTVAGVLTALAVVVAQVFGRGRPAVTLALGRWWIVPGGVLVCHGRGSRWDVVRIDRRHAVLLVVEYRRGHGGHAWIRCPAGLTIRRLTATELRMLLSAWLSPLEPPAAQQLSDLAGAADQKD